ncbi:MAG: RIP metalloprotease RseP [Alphaproteobacteria bacterium]|nr:RIP metalloprotease RseP [Alphaproteobacteria bacterium]
MELISSIWGYAWPFLATITVIVFVHELGHYLVARANGVRIEVFSIGFGPELFGFRDSHGTRWKLSLLPLGGYVKFFGDANVASGAKDPATFVPIEEDRRVSFYHKRVGQRAAVVVGGPLGNFVFAIIVFAFLFGFVGERYTAPDIVDVLPGGAAESAGIKPGDRLIAIQGQPVERFEDLQSVVETNPGTPLSIVVRRGEAEIALTAIPELTQVTDGFGGTRQIGRLGVKGGQVAFREVGTGEAMWGAVRETFTIAISTLKAVGQMISGSRSTEELGGPIQIGRMSGEIAKDGAFFSLIYFMAILSINLGLINLFPVPMLDGGHLIFYVWEAIAGRPLKPRVQEIGMRVGFVLVIALMVWVTSKDLIRLGVLDLF